jgi:hypothetical protein
LSAFQGPAEKTGEIKATISIGLLLLLRTARPPFAGLKKLGQHRWAPHHRSLSWEGGFIHMLCFSSFLSVIGLACPSMKNHRCQYLRDCLWTWSDVTGNLDTRVFFLLGHARPILKAALVQISRSKVDAQRYSDSENNYFWMK